MKQSNDLSVLRKLSRIPITHVIATLFVSPRLIMDSRPHRLKLPPIVVQLGSDDPMILMRPTKFGDVMWRRSPSPERGHPVITELLDREKGKKKILSAAHRYLMHLRFLYLCLISERLKNQVGTTDTTCINLGLERPHKLLDA